MTATDEEYDGLEARARNAERRVAQLESELKEWRDASEGHGEAFCGTPFYIPWKRKRD